MFVSSTYSGFDECEVEFEGAAVSYVGVDVAAAAAAFALVEVSAANCIDTQALGTIHPCIAAARVILKTRYNCLNPTTMKLNL